MKRSVSIALINSLHFAFLSLFAFYEIVKKLVTSVKKLLITPKLLERFFQKFDQILDEKKSQKVIKFKDIRASTF